MFAYMLDIFFACKQAFVQKCFKSIDSSATSETFVTHGEIVIDFLNTPTNEPKSNHWVSTTLNHLVIQFVH